MLLKMKKIKAYKGGRTEIIPPMRVTKEEKEIIEKARNGKSYSDFIVELSKKEVSRKHK